MCFSANASFTAGTVLTIIGVASVLKAPHRSQILFASIPFLFGIQQLAEGILWLTLPDPHNILTQKVFTYIFLFFAQVVWPVWVPLAFLLLEKSTNRRTGQKMLVAAGALVGLYLFYCLLNYNVTARIEQRHIVYLQEYPSIFRGYGVALYALATVAPPFFSSIRRMWIFGLAIMASYIISALFYEHYVLSVWCFFASIISIVAYLIILKLGREKQMKNYSATFI